MIHTYFLFLSFYFTNSSLNPCCYYYCYLFLYIKLSIIPSKNKPKMKAKEEKIYIKKKPGEKITNEKAARHDRFHHLPPRS